MIARSHTAALLSLSLLVSLCPLVDTAQAQGLPDYAVENIVTAPSPAEAGRSIVFKATVRNVSSTRGTQRGNAVLKIDQGANGTWDKVSTRAIFGSLSVGSTSNPSWGNTGVPPPIDWQPVVGTHKAQVCINTNTGEDSMYFADSNAANDCKTITFTIGAPPASSATAIPDFSVEDLRFFQDSTGYAMTVVVKNSGGATDKWAQVRLSIDTTVEVMTYGIKPLAQNATDTAVWSSSVLPPKNGWSPTPGSHHATACMLQESDSPADSNAANNCRSLTFTIAGAAPAPVSSVPASSAAPLPDYRATTARFERMPTGSNFEFFGTVENAGGATNVPSTIHIYFDYGNNGSFDTSVSQPNIAGLGQGRTREIHLINLLPLPAGQHLLRFCTDSEEDIREQIETNNCRAVTVQDTSPASARSSSVSSAAPLSSQASSAAALPDFFIDRMDITPSEEDGKFNAWAAVKNRGAPAHVPTFVIFEHRRIGGNTGWESIVPAQDVPPLATGQQSTGRWENHGRGQYGTYTFRAGTYEFRACADAWNVLPESDESNCSTPMRVVFGADDASSNSSVSSRSSRVSSARSRTSASSVRSRSSTRGNSSADIADTSLPNLMIRTMTIRPVSFATGETWSVQAKVVNMGATPSQETAVRLKIDERMNGSEDFLSSIEMVVPPLQPGRMFTVRWSSGDPSGNLNWVPRLGRHRVILCVNERRQSPEWNADDNCAKKTVTVRKPAPTRRSSSSSSRSSLSSSSPSSTAESPAARTATRPDYAVTSLTIHPPAPVMNDSLSIIGAITNSGSSANQPTVASLQIDEGNNEGVDYTELTPIMVQLAAEESQFAQWSTNNNTLRWTKKAGTHRAIICVNPYGTTFPEMDIGDNCMEQIFVLTP